MSNTPQQPADGWQPSQQQQPPVYRPQEQPPTEEPPPWSPESQRVSPPSQPVVEEDGTVKYVGGPGVPSPQYGPPPGVPVSPFDAPPPQPHPGVPVSDPFGGGGGVPVSGMPGPGMPPVSSIPASGMPVSSPIPGQPQYGQPPFGQQPPYGGGQFGPQGGQLVPVSGGAQPWGAPDAIKRKKKGGKGPMALLLVGIVVIAAALGVGGFVLFNSDSGDPKDQATGTIDAVETPPEPVLVAGDGGLKFIADGAAAAWADSAEAPAVFTGATGKAAEDGTGAVYVGVLDLEGLGIAADAELGDVGPVVDAKLAETLGAISGEVAVEGYWIDGRQSEFRTFTAGDTTVVAAVVQVQDGFEAFVGTAQGDAADAVEAARLSLRFGDM